MMSASRITLVAIAVTFAGPLVLLGAQLQARADDTAEISLESGTRARPINRKLQPFPRREANAGIEGWVEVSYVIKPDGTVGETIIENSSGRKAFERATIKSIKKWRYEPATMNGEPIEQCHTKVRIMFALEQPPGKARGARGSFRKKYKDAIELLNKGKFEKTRSTIDKMEDKYVTNLYERSRLWILRSMLQEKEGDDRRQLESLVRGVSGGGQYVEPKVHLAVMLKIFNLQMQFQHYADALETLETLEGLDLDDDVAVKLALFKNQIAGLRTAAQTLAIEGEIGEAQEEHHGAGMWWHTLLRRTAGIESVSGSLERVELRCDWRRVKAKPEKGRAWRIPPDWGDCSIYVFGEPGSTFQLLEYSSTPS
jgi:TonB family protein